MRQEPDVGPEATPNPFERVIDRIEAETQRMFAAFFDRETQGHPEAFTKPEPATVDGYMCGRCGLARDSIGHQLAHDNDGFNTDGGPFCDKPDCSACARIRAAMDGVER